MPFDLPDELMLHTFRFLRLKDLPSALRVQKKDWKRIIDHNNFFLEKTGLTKAKFKQSLLNLDFTSKKLYLNQEKFYFIDNNIEYPELIKLGVFTENQIKFLKTKPNHLEILFSLHGMLAIYFKLITPEQAVQFREEVLKILLSPQGLLDLHSKVYAIEDLLKILQEGPHYRDNDKMAALYDILKLNQSLPQHSLLNFNAAEVINLLLQKYVAREIILTKGKYALIQGLINLYQAAQLPPAVLTPLFSERGILCLEQKLFSANQVIQMFNLNKEFYITFGILMSKDVAINLLRDKIFAFEEIASLAICLTQICLSDVVVKALYMKLITPKLIFEFKNKPLELEKFVINLIQAIDEKLFTPEQVLEIIPKHFDLLRQQLVPEDGLIAYREKSMTLDQLPQFDEQMDYEFSIVCKQSMKDPELDEQQRAMKNFYQQQVVNPTASSSSVSSLLKEEQLKKITDLAPDLLKGEVLIQILKTFSPEQINSIVNIENFIKAVQHKNALYAFKNHLITLDEIQSSFDLELDLSTEMLTAKQNSIPENNNNDELDYFSDDNENENDEVEDDLMEAQSDEEQFASETESNESSNTNSRSIRGSF